LGQKSYLVTGEKETFRLFRWGGEPLGGRCPGKGNEGEKTFGWGSPGGVAFPLTAKHLFHSLSRDYFDRSQGGHPCHSYKGKVSEVDSSINKTKEGERDSTTKGGSQMQNYMEDMDWSTNSPERKKPNPFRDFYERGKKRSVVLHHRTVHKGGGKFHYQETYLKKRLQELEKGQKKREKA